MKKIGIILFSLTVLLMTTGTYAADSDLNLAGDTINIGTMGVGDEFVVTLEDNSASTGYEWWLRSSTYGVMLISHEYLPPISPRYGAPGKKVYTFKVTEPGVQSVMFELLRPWDTMHPLDRKIYNVTVVE